MTQFSTGQSQQEMSLLLGPARLVLGVFTGRVAGGLHHIAATGW